MWSTSGAAIIDWHSERRSRLILVKHDWVLRFVDTDGEGSPLYSLELDGDVLHDAIYYDFAKDFLRGRVRNTDTYTEIDGGSCTISGAKLRLTWLRNDMADWEGFSERLIEEYMAEPVKEEQ